MSAEAECSVRLGLENFGGIKRVSHFFSAVTFEKMIFKQDLRGVSKDWLKGFENSANGRSCPGVAEEKAI